MIESQDLSRPALRRKLRQARRALSPLQQRLAARALYRQLAQHPLFRRARHIALYLPNDGEIDPRPLLRAAQKRGKATYLPVLAPWPRTRMVFQRVGSGERWTRNRFRISEPLADAATSARPGRWTWYCCRWWGSTNRAGAWAWAAASTTAAWPTWRGAKMVTNRR